MQPRLDGNSRKSISGRIGMDLVSGGEPLFLQKSTKMSNITAYHSVSF
jgi:hypothetical protein